MSDHHGSSPGSNMWANANGGLRGSKLLLWGSAGYFLSSILNALMMAVSPSPLGPENPAFLVAIAFWIVTLLVIGSGFFWTGLHPFMTRFGLAVGLYSYFQAGYLFVSLVRPEMLVIPPSILTMERTFLMGVFAVIERKYIGPKAAWILGLGSAFQLARIALRTFGPYPHSTPMTETFLSIILMSLTAFGLFKSAQAIWQQEELWATENQPQRNAGFSDFNNPQHRWNKQEREEQG